FLRRRPIRTAPFFQGRSAVSEWGQTPLWHHSDTREQQMRGRVLAGIATLAIGWSGGALAGAGQQGIGQSPSSLPLTPTIREKGSSVTPAFEGWYYGKDGSHNLLIGYLHPNTKH